MAEIFQTGVPITIVWTLTKPDGTAFSLEGYQYQLFYCVGNRYREAAGSTVSGNVISWVFPSELQSAVGDYSLRLKLFQNGYLFNTIDYNRAFTMMRGDSSTNNLSQQEQSSDVVSLFTVAEFYLLSPVIPTIGSDKYWYVNGTIVTDSNGEYLSAEHTLRYDETTKYLIIDEGRVDAHGESIQQTITDVAEALADWESRYAAAEGTADSTAGDGSRWGSYKSAEASRDASYQASEGTATSTTDDGSRWGNYKAAEASREASYGTEEGSMSDSTAGDGSRWGSYKAAEESREESYGTEEGSVSSTAGDGSRWGAYKSAEADRDAESALAEGTSGSTAGDGSRWGAYKSAETDRQSSYGDAETNRDSAYLTAEGNSTSVAGDGSRWGKYKTAEAARDAISSEDHTQAEADHTRAGEDHTQAAQDHQQAVSDHETWADKADTDGYYERMGVGTAKNLEGVVSQSAEIIFRKTGGSASVDSGLATMSSIKGKSIVWNQQVASANKDKEISRDNTSGSSVVYGNASISIPYYTNAINGHTIFAKALVVNNGGDADACKEIYINDAVQRNIIGGVIYTANCSSADSRVVLYGVNIGKNLEAKITVLFIDLTLMFGAGNEPTTVAEFEAMYPLPYYAYNAGEIVSNKATAIETVGFNQWDEEWESGKYDTAAGGKISDANCIRCKNKIPAFQNIVYYVQCPSGKTLQLLCYDGSGNMIKSWNSGYNWKTFNASGLFTTPAGTQSMAFHLTATTYNHDICINLSDPAKNGTYEPYEKHTLNLNLPTLTGKLNGEGSSVVIAPEGMAGQDGWEDLGIVENGYLTKIIKKTPREEVDLGTLTWNAYNGTWYANNQGMKPSSSQYDVGNAICTKYVVGTLNDTVNKNVDKQIAINNGQSRVNLYDSTLSESTSSQVAAALSGVKLIFELATPQTYVLDNPVYVGYLEDGGGTERRLPEDTSSSVLAPLACDVTYPIDAVGALQKLPENFISKESMQAFLASLGTAMDGTWTMTWNAAAGKYSFTFTPNA